MSTEALELEIEELWVGLSWQKCSVYLAKSRPPHEGWRLLRYKEALNHSEAELVGTYTKSVRLADFRGDVFHVLEDMTRRGHRAA